MDCCCVSNFYSVSVSARAFIHSIWYSNTCQLFVSYSASSGISSESMVLSNHSLNVFNKTNEHLFTKRLITTSHYKDIPITSVQLKDFGKYTRNRKCLLYYCYL